MLKFHFCCSQDKRNVISMNNLTRLEISFCLTAELTCINEQIRASRRKAGGRRLAPGPGAPLRRL